jgi:hypothetical protein
MAYSRFTASLLTLAMILANACCLLHPVAASAQGTAKPAHACCHQTAKTQHPGEKIPPGKSGDCCQRTVADVDHSPASQHSTLLPLSIASADLTAHFAGVASLATLPFDATAPPSADVLQQSCSLIL